MKVFRLIILAITLSSSVALATQANSKIIQGMWGGDGISMFATPAGADGNFFCSFGRILDPITPDEDGYFCSTGYVDYFDGTQEPAKNVTAQFSGHVHGKQMDLEVKMDGREPWHFTLTKGVKGQAYECFQ